MLLNLFEDKFQNVVFKQHCWYVSVQIYKMFKQFSQGELRTTTSGIIFTNLFTENKHTYLQVNRKKRMSNGYLRNWFTPPPLLEFKIKVQTDYKVTDIPVNRYFFSIDAILYKQYFILISHKEHIYFKFIHIYILV